MAPGVFMKEDFYCRNRWRQVQYLTDVFWKRWLAEYSPSLQERQKWVKPRQNFAVGDLVLIADERVHGGQWPLGVSLKSTQERMDSEDLPRLQQRPPFYQDLSPNCVSSRVEHYHEMTEY